MKGKEGRKDQRIEGKEGRGGGGRQERRKKEPIVLRFYQTVPCGRNPAKANRRKEGRNEVW
jgi:hypothetical protein